MYIQWSLMTIAANLPIGTPLDVCVQVHTAKGILSMSDFSSLLISLFIRSWFKMQ